LLTASGFILSNNHVVSADRQSNTVTVGFADGRSAPARIVGTDPRTDLAVVQVSGVANLKPATLGDSSAMEVGDTVLALGSPLGLEGSVTAGIISAKDRTIQAGSQGQPNDPFAPQQQQGATSISGLLQTDAPINPGNSGGALVNTNGDVIGINTAIATSGQSTGNIGVGFAIPSNKAKIVADALMNGRKVSHPYLGVNLGSTADGKGALLSTVAPNGPAAQAGLKVGDVITEVNGKPVRKADDVVAAVQGGTVGQKLELKYTRNGQAGTASATLAEAP
jgi:putative serine protease PepD